MSDPLVVYFFPNGNAAACQNGEQVPPLQVSWLRLFVDHLVAHGVDPTTAEYHLPHGGRARVFRVSDDYGGGFSWEVLS